ncbi:MAG: AbrB/MazE/SpoVT family DNA-binding domain-containing protein [Firmicutes bacterium]|nr:AbrB/MazE/SpoVT family DNA-binding domain-containing protein [Bacillota bacterium]MCL2770694.1 AbrB/MazE/SpoVT family DNA-binding domain-containing protein [Bacillota bacterium]
MKSGIIRRVDDLGRIVIPKEIRRSLKIKTGAPLEISLVGEEELSLRRVDSLLSVVINPDGFASTVAEFSGCSIIIVNDSEVSALSGFKKSMIGLPITNKLISHLENREQITITATLEALIERSPIEHNAVATIIIEPLINDSSVLGGIVAVCLDIKKVEEVKTILRYTSALVRVF